MGGGGRKWDGTEVERGTVKQEEVNSEVGRRGSKVGECLVTRVHNKMSTQSMVTYMVYWHLLWEVLS